MSNKQYALAMWLAALIFWVAYLVMSGIRPEYFHLYKAVSELGSVGASNAVVWNIFGFILPGILISVFSVGLHQSISVDGKGKLAFYALFACGLFWVFAGIFPGDFDNKTSLTMILHTVGSLGSGLMFFIAVFSYIPAMRMSGHWRGSVVPSVAITLLFIASGFLRTGSTPALGQKVGFFIFFAWLSYMAFRLYRDERGH